MGGTLRLQSPLTPIPSTCTGSLPSFLTVTDMIVSFPATCIMAEVTVTLAAERPSSSRSSSGTWCTVPGGAV